MSEGQAGWAVTGGLGGDCCEWPDGCWSRKWKHTHETSSLVSPGLTLMWWWQWEILLTLSWARSAWAKSLWRGAAQWLLLTELFSSVLLPSGIRARALSAEDVIQQQWCYPTLPCSLTLLSSKFTAQTRAELPSGKDVLWRVSTITEITLHLVHHVDVTKHMPLFSWGIANIRVHYI